MKCKAALAFTLVTVAVMVFASAASAFQHIDYASLTSGEKAAMEADIAAWDTSGFATATEAGMGEAAVAGGVEVGVAGLASGVVLGAGAGYLAYRVSRGTLGNYVYRLWTDSDTVAWTGVIDGTNYTYVPNSGVGTCPTGVYPCWFWGYHGTPGGNDNVVVASPGSGCGIECSTDARNAFAPVTATIALYGTFGGGNVQRKYRLSADMTADGSMHPISSGTYSGLSSGAKVDKGTTVLSATCDATCLQNALTGINAPTGGTQTTNQAAAVNKLRDDAGLNNAAMPDCTGLSLADCTTAYGAAGFTGAVSHSTASFSGADTGQPAESVISQDHTGGSFALATNLTVVLNPVAVDMPFDVFKPGPNETYDAYVDRLTAAGYLGSISRTDLDSSSEDPTTGPDAIARIKITVGTNTVTTTYRRSTYPFPYPQIKAGSDVVAYVNPVTTPAVAAEHDPATGTPGSDLPGGGDSGDTSVPAGAIDFTPITDLDPGCKFPYGFICYAQQVNAWFDVSPEAPEFDLPVHGATVSGTHVSQVTLAQHYDVNLNVMDDYMSIIRTLESIVIWIGAVYILATRLLGFHAAGDPGAAIDEVMNE